MRKKLNRDVTKEECEWLIKDFLVGEEVDVFTGYTYGSISPMGEACTLDGQRFFELPKDALDDIGDTDSFGSGDFDDYSVTIRKVESLQKSDREDGYTFRGNAKNLPTKGAHFRVSAMSRWFETSTVLEIIEQKASRGKFKTKNSIYEWEINKDE